VLGLFKETGQPLQLVNAFEKPVSSRNGLMDASIAALKQHHEHLKTTWAIKPTVEVAIPDKSLDQFCAELLTHVWYGLSCTAVGWPPAIVGLCQPLSAPHDGPLPDQERRDRPDLRGDGLGERFRGGEQNASGTVETEDDHHRHPSATARE